MTPNPNIQLDQQIALIYPPLDHIYIAFISLEKNCIATMYQNLVLLNAEKALNNPIWKKSMDKEYQALINKHAWEIVMPLKNTHS